MAYLEHTPASLTDLMDTLKTFAIANGGFTDVDTEYSASSYNYFALTKGSIKFGITYKDTSGGGDIMLNTSTAWAGSGLLTAQTGACTKNARAYVGLTPLKAFMFSDGTSVHCIVHFRTGAYAHISFGLLTKSGTYTGSEFVSANYWTQATWHDNDNSRHFDGYTILNTNAYMNHVRVTNGATTIAVMGCYNQSGLGHIRNLWMAGGLYNAPGSNGELWLHQPNSYNGRAVKIPIELFLAYDQSSSTNPSGWIPLGQVANVAIVNIANLTAEQVVDTDWVVFPLCMKNAGSPSLANGEVNTGNFGLAYKK